MRTKIFLFGFLLSLPFWWAVDIFTGKLENFLFLQHVAKNPQILTAQADSQIFEEKLRREKIIRNPAAEELEINAKSAISVKIDEKGNEQIFFEKNSQTPLPIASLTKLMTSLVVFDLDETYDLSQEIIVSREAVNQEEKYGDLKEGEKLSVENLLYIMLIESSNDAAFALADFIGEEGFVEIMNLYAKDLGLENTKFVNSTGLEPDNLQDPINISTARDLVKLGRYILENYPQIFEITANKSYEVFKSDGSLHHFIPENTNLLLREIPEIIGGKTGWGIEAEGCLLLVLKEPQRNGYFINVILGSKDRFNEMKEMIEKIRD